MKINQGYKFCDYLCNGFRIFLEVMEKLFLYPITLVLRWLSKAHKFWLSRRKVSRKLFGDFTMVVVGSCRMGGGCKTPITAEIARWFHNKGMRVAVLAPPLFSPSGKGRQVPLTGDWRIWGDEPLWLAKQLAPIPVFCWNNRVDKWRELGNIGGFDMVFCDDGLEDPSLQHAVRILLQGEEPEQSLFELWPAGPFRSLATDHVGALKMQWGSWWKANKDSDWIYDLSHPCNVMNLPLNSPAWLVCGLGNPARLLADLQVKGIVLEGKTVLYDHSSQVARQVKNLLGKSMERKILVTAKDWIKLDSSQKEDSRIFLLEQKWLPTDKCLRQMELWKNID